MTISGQELSQIVDNILYPFLSNNVSSHQERCKKNEVDVMGYSINFKESTQNDNYYRYATTFMAKSREK